MNTLSRFIGYSLFGISAFAIDLGLIFIFTDTLGLVYTLAVPLAFLLATSLHYGAARTIVFHDSTRPLGTGYLFFISIMIGSALLITGLVYALVEYRDMNVYVARVLVAGFVGLISFYLNARYNFKVPMG